MQYFTNEYINFFLDLEKNNRKEWFHENKKRYENHVRKPMIAFTADLIEQMQKYDPEIEAIASKSLGRINRDIRFSKDKTPYNRHLFAHIFKGTKANAIPGIAYRFGGGDCGIMTGYYTPSKERLYSIRKKIASDISTFQKLISNKNFKEKFGEVLGEKNKRIPAEFADAHEKEHLIANKQFYYVAEKEAQYVTSENLLDDILQHWLTAKPINDFLT